MMFFGYIQVFYDFCLDAFLGFTLLVSLIVLLKVTKIALTKNLFLRTPFESFDCLFLLFESIS